MIEDPRNFKVSMSISIPIGLRDQLRQRAQRNDRSTNREIWRILEMAVREEEAGDARGHL